MSEENFDFTSLYGATHFPTLKILVNVANEQLKEGVPMDTVLRESLEFAVSQAVNYHTDLVVNANQQVSDGLRKLKRYEAWPNLSAVAKHALELEEDLLRRDEKLDDIAEVTSLRRKILDASISELSKIFKDEWLAENFPSLHFKSCVESE